MKDIDNFVIKKGFNCLQSAFLNLLRLSNINLSDELFQFRFVGVRLNKKNDLYNQYNTIHGNFDESVFDFCEKNDVTFVEEEVKGDCLYIKNKFLDVLNKNGPFLVFLSTKFFKYDRSFENENDMRHCVVVYEVNDEGVYIIDSYAAAAEVNTFQGLLSYDNFNFDENMNICKIENRDKINIHLYNDKECFTRRVKEYFMENTALETHSRCYIGIEYCKYLKKRSLQITSEELRNIALNILVDTHVPQLRLVVAAMQSLNIEKEELEALIRKWIVISFKFFKFSMRQNYQKFEIHLNDYEKLLLMEVEIYQKMQRGEIINDKEQNI